MSVELSHSSYNSVNPDLQRERDGASFNKDELTVILCGGPEGLERKKYIESVIRNDPHFDQKERCTVPAEEAFDRGVKRSVRWVAVKDKFNLNQPGDERILRRCVYNDLALSIHSLMFIPTIEKLGTEEQTAKWLPLATKYQILGTYAQTELGHGTYLNGLEMTATYDEEAQEFDVHSPTLTAMKWWPGGLGKCCTHCIMMAQLVVRGRRCGLQAFMVPLRSLETHQPLPGVTIGDIGEKMGLIGFGNGFLLLDHVRIPRLNMMMKYAVVTPEGEFSRRGNQKAIYGTMLQVRSWIVSETPYVIANAVVVATRYSIVRKQGPIEKRGPEVSVLDYQTQQQKVFPGIACAYGSNYVSLRIQELVQENEAKLQRNDFSYLVELHALLSGLKAVMTKEMTFHSEACRFACGGHGYLLQSSLPTLYAGAAASCTFEGENTVLLLQTAGYLMKCLSKAQTGQTFEGFGAYLAEEPPTSWSCDQEDMARHPGVIVEAFKRRAQWLSRRAGERLAILMGNGLSQQQAWNKASIDLVKAAVAHTQYFIIGCFFDGVEQSTVSPSTRTVLHRLSLLYPLYLIELNSGEFLADAYMTSEQLSWLHGHYLDLLALIRPDAVALVDAFDIHDDFLQSTLGSYDGNVYQRIYEYAKNSPRNRKQVHETYYKYLRPLLKGMIAKL